LAEFQTSSLIDRDYHSSAITYRQSKNGIANYDHFSICILNLAGFDPQTARNRTRVRLTYNQLLDALISGTKRWHPL